jgi:GT2 family glycosyltransferase
LSNIALSVVVVAYRSAATLPVMLDALRDETEGRPREVILVESSGEPGEEEARRRWPWLRLIALPNRALPGRARNVGVSATRGDVIAFVDADAVPERGWLDALEQALTPDVDAVAGAVLNGTPRSAVGTAGYLLEFANWLPSRRGAIEHGATCNLLVRRGALEAAGGFREDIWGGEDTLFTYQLAKAGRLAFAPAARVAHLNRTRLLDYMRHQVRLGRAFAHVCAGVDFPHGWLGRPVLAPLAFPFRLAALARAVFFHPREAGQAALLLPLLVVGSAAWAVGLARADR